MLTRLSRVVSRLLVNSSSAGLQPMWNHYLHVSAHAQHTDQRTLSLVLRLRHHEYMPAYQHPDNVDINPSPMSGALYIACSTVLDLSLHIHLLRQNKRS